VAGMEFVIHLVLVLHFLALAAILGGWIAQRTGGHALSSMVWGARAQLLIGLLLVGLNEMNGEALNHMKVGVKLLVMLGVLAAAEIANARARKGQPRPALVDAAAGLTVLNVLVATLW
jgi:hypothetical protein